MRVNNGEQLDVMPLVGDFNFYGGIYRDVHLLITDEACISPLNYASPGVRLIQDSAVSYTHLSSGYTECKYQLFAVFRF